MIRPTPPSEILARFSRRSRAGAGLVIYALADQLAKLDEHQLAALGVVIAGEATEWLMPDEAGYPESMREVDELASRLFDRLDDAAAWDAQFDD